MKYLRIITAVLFGACMAGPFRPPNWSEHKGQFSIRARRNANCTPHGPLAYAKAYLKHDIAMPTDLKDVYEKIMSGEITDSVGDTVVSATQFITSIMHLTSLIPIPLQTLEPRLEVRQDTSGPWVQATPEAYDSEYNCEVMIGDPAQVLNLNFDTGSSDLWVFSSELASDQSSGHNLYEPADSETSEYLSGESWSISYGDGSTSSGDVYADTVQIGSVAVTSQAVEAAKEVSDSFVSDTGSDGILGLAFSTLNQVSPTRQSTWLENAINDGDLWSELFTAHLLHNKDGWYNFGYIDDSQHTGTIGYADVDESWGYWKFTIPGFTVGYKPYNATSITAIADTGTSLLLLPDGVVQAYYSCVTGAAYDSSWGGWTFPCSSALPILTFTIDSSGTNFTVPGNYMNYAPLDSAGTTCYGGLQSDTGIGFSIFGDVVLKAAFVVFDYGNMQMGFASKNLS
ncbi:Secreted aspartic proteinase [Pleurostoma richardsiae]|uniref:Secreted aspartic proteinase n=1 Tax=Pleurostoma richardsiae TaxID=41990 RepID=A0AA38VGQ1_9PEZI|nr:Secreted aspartic proteinase [Pleurostoma richardsiae]